MTVELVNWPQDRERRVRLRADNKPCLLLVASDSAPPLIDDPVEDWVRLPADNRDIQARIESLSRRVDDQPTIDTDGILRTSGGWVPLPDVEARMVIAMLERFGRVTDRAALFAAGWPRQDPSRNLLDVHLHRLRRRIQPVGLRIRTVRKRGYVLEPS